MARNVAKRRGISPNSTRRFPIPRRKLPRFEAHRHAAQRVAAAWDGAGQKQHNVAFQIRTTVRFSPIHTILESQ
jgi:hypothetical protein